MATGELQLGDEQFEQRAAAAIPVADDTLNNPITPTYAAFGACDPNLRDGTRSYNLVGQPATAIWYRDCPGGVDMEKATQHPETAFALYDETIGVNIPGVFWRYVQQAGDVLEHGNRTTAQPLFDWLYVLGHPITEAYWTKTVIGGVEQDVLVQLFERRVLTYTPGNPDGWQVEMGNVGQHYYRWRYDTPLTITHVDCVAVEQIVPDSPAGRAITAQALSAINALPQVAGSAAFADVWSLERVGAWYTLQASFAPSSGLEAGIVVLHRTDAESLLVQVVWGGPASTAQEIRTYLARQAPDAPNELIACLAPHGFVVPQP